MLLVEQHAHLLSPVYRHQWQVHFKYLITNRLFSVDLIAHLSILHMPAHQAFFMINNMVVDLEGLPLFYSCFFHNVSLSEKVFLGTCVSCDVVIIQLGHFLHFRPARVEQQWVWTTTSCRCHMRGSHDNGERDCFSHYTGMINPRLIKLSTPE